MKIEIGQTAEVSKTISESDVYAFAGITGDFNPVYVNKKEADQSRFGGQVCHGMLVSSFISNVLGTKLPGPGTIYKGQNSKFLAPVYIGDTITARVTVTEIDGKKVTLHTDVINQRGEKVITGTADVLYDQEYELTANKDRTFRFNVGEEYPQFDFMITGASYAGNPSDGTVMFVSNKVIYLLDNLAGHKNCLVFAPTGAEISEETKQQNGIIFCDNPQYEFAAFATKLENKIQERNKKRHYHELNGSIIGENVSIGEGTYIEPGCFIDHDVKIGSYCKILSGCRIRNAVLGNGCIINENAVIGNASFTMAESKNGEKLRIPALGNVVIGNEVEVGPLDDIARATCGSTILEDRVKLDSLVHIGHEAHLHEDVEITAGATIGGFVEIGRHGYMGVGSAVKNRTALGENSLVGMGAVVLKTVEDNTVVVGNPAKFLKRNV